MSLFNLPVHIKPKKTVPEHPWAKTIKEYYANKIKRAHNSLRNVVYPRSKERIPLKRVTFTVIGNRVSREFIYCVKMVQGMHRYRWKHYDTPVIRGCTGIEWPQILHEIKINSGFNYCHDIQAAVLRDGEFIGGQEELKGLIESLYIYHLALNYQKESLKIFSDYLKASGRPCVYMHISIDGKPIGSLIFMLYSDIAPVTCENFLRLCQAKRGGYSGTPVHRIVKDGWIQCGGFGLKSTDMDCENFIVPHDKRGVLGMANAGRHNDCSTQFYVLLQPNEWLKFKFTAFGQLIEGENTLKKIEESNTYYEAPTSNIIIYRAGIVNLDCQDIRINKGALEYLDGHVEDLVTIGEMFYETLLERVWLEIEFRRIQNLEPVVSEEEDYGEAFKETVNADRNIIRKHIVATRRFMHKKEGKQKIQNRLKAEDVSNETKSKTNHDVTVSNRNRANKSTKDDENIQFDVEEYDYDYEYKCEDEEENLLYDQIAPFSLPKPTKPYIIPLTDVIYPGEIDSNFDLKRLLKGDYCLETDLESSKLKKNTKIPKPNKHKLNAISLFISMQNDIECDPAEKRKRSIDSLDEEERVEISNYLSMYGDKTSFAGDKIQDMARQYCQIHPLEDKGSKEWFTDEDIRIMRKAERNYNESKKNVSFMGAMNKGSTIKRRPTRFLLPEESIKLYRKQHEGDEEVDDRDLQLESDTTIVLEDSRKRQPRSVLISDDPTQTEEMYPEEQYSKKRKSSTRGIVRIVPEATSRVFEQRVSVPYRSSYADYQRLSHQRQSVLSRLFDDINTVDDVAAPKLKDYKPLDEIGKKGMKLAVTDSTLPFSLFHRGKRQLSDVDRTDSFHFYQEKRQSMRPSVARTSNQFSRIMEEGRIKMKTRQPKMTVSEYQRKNDIRREQAKKLDVDLPKTKLYTGSIRLPGDTPLYSPIVSIHERRFY